jgi:hypothetical protein
MNEADTCRKFVLPKFQAAGWENDPHSIAEQRFFTEGRIVVRGNKAERGNHRQIRRGGPTPQRCEPTANAAIRGLSHVPAKPR